jgi:predicted MFS family arabinose efflux permease
MSKLYVYFLIFLGNKKPTSSNLLKLDLLMSTINHMRDPNQMLLIPITLWLGFSLAFIGADYTKSFVACSKGVDKVGFAMICFGLTDALGSYAFGELHKLLGRKACFCIGAAINYITLFIMLFWKVRKILLKSCVM